jgi:hypothetical protein
MTGERETNSAPSQPTELQNMKPGEKAKYNHPPAPQQSQQSNFRVELYHGYNDLTDMYRTLCPTAGEYTFCSAAHEIFS